MENKNSNKKSWQPALFLFLKISGWIALPIVASLIVGKWLDRKFDSEPIVFLGLTGIAFIVSMIGIVKESRKAMTALETPEKNVDVIKE